MSDVVNPQTPSDNLNDNPWESAAPPPAADPWSAAASSPAASFRSVLLPEPLGPTMPHSGSVPKDSAGICRDQAADS